MYPSIYNDAGLLDPTLSEVIKSKIRDGVLELSKDLLINRYIKGHCGRELMLEMAKMVRLPHILRRQATSS